MAEDVGALARKFSQPMRAAQPQDWASEVLNTSHDEALFTYGEYGLFTLMWRPEDYDAGRVGRCQTCFGGVYARQAAAFQQSTQRRCPDCYGTTFEGGYRAQIIRPMIMADRSTVIADQREGTTETDTIQFDTTSEFTFTLGDYVFRHDNTRYQCEAGGEATVRTGFDAPNSIESLTNTAVAHLEDPTTVAYMIPPADPAALSTLLTKSGPFTIADIETLNVLVRPGGYV